MIRRLTACVALWLLVCVSPLANATCYVNAAAPGGNGTSWAAAYTDLQLALTNAACTPIWVARGTYKPTATADRTISFSVKPFVQVYGGFAGTEAALTDRVLAGNPTILSGDIGVAGDNSDNSYHVVVMDGTTVIPIVPSTVLADLTISDGNANGAGAYAFGGGLYCNGQGVGHTCSPQFARVIFENNSAVSGGAIYNDGHGGGVSSPWVHDVIARNNRAANYGGGAMYNNGNGGTSSPIVDKVTFIGNNGSLAGGAMYNDGTAGVSSPTVTNTTFYANTALLGGAISNLGGTAGHASPVLHYDTFYKNKATAGPGGAIFSLATDGDAAPMISGVIFWADEATGVPVENYVNSQTASTIDYYITPETCPLLAVGCLNDDPLLGPLQDNGGFPPTMRPEIGSPAIDNGNTTYCPPDDERGLLRPWGPRCDIGAVELKLNEQKVCYVNSAAAPGNFGESWATAYPTLNSALADASCSEVWVALGNYVPTTGIDPTATFSLPPGKAVYGGFAGNETARSQRDPSNYVTTLSGAFNNGIDHAYHVVVIDATAAATNVTGNTVLDGFTISGGNANGSNLQGYGGGLLCNGQGYSCNPTLSNLVFKTNNAHYGGGLANYGVGGVASPTLTNVTFTGNQATTNDGGGIMNLGSGGVSSPILSAVTFVGNYAAHQGGAMASHGTNGISDPQVSGTTFTNNYVTFAGGALYVHSAKGSYSGVDFVGNNSNGGAGAVYIDGLSSPSFASAHFIGNTATVGGGAVSCVAQAGSAPSFSDVNFSGNVGSPGGAIKTSSGSLTFDHAAFDGNTGNLGGAVETTGGSLTFSDALFIHNGDAVSTQNGGAIAVVGGNASVTVNRAAFIENISYIEGGAVWTTVDADQGASTQITNATFWGNQSNYGSAVVTKANGTSASASTTLISVTLSANVAGQHTIVSESINKGFTYLTVSDAIVYGDTMTSGLEIFDPSPYNVTSVDHSFVQGSCFGPYIYCTFVTGVDPLLGILQYNSGFTPTMMPAANSTAISFGSSCPAVDQRGVPRPQGAGCDVGAVERRSVEDEVFSNGFDF